MRLSPSRLLPPAAALAAALLLRLAYPPFTGADVAFFALAPLLLALRFATPRQGFRLGFLFGLDRKSVV